MIRHCVLCRFRSDVTDADKATVYAALDALRGVVPGILGASFGPNVSPEGIAQGFEDGFIIDFADTAARDAYLIHPDHVAAGGALVALLDGDMQGLVVFDIDVPDRSHDASRIATGPGPFIDGPVLRMQEHGQFAIARGHDPYSWASADRAPATQCPDATSSRGSRASDTRS